MPVKIGTRALVKAKAKGLGDASFEASATGAISAGIVVLLTATTGPQVAAGLGIVAGGVALYWVRRRRRDRE